MTVAELLGVSPQAISLAHSRGRDLLTSHGWSIDDVLSWRVLGR